MATGSSYDFEQGAERDVAASQLPLSSQERALVELHDIIEELTMRLKPVLTPSTPMEVSVKDDSEKMAEPLQSPLATQLSGNNNSISNASRKIRRLIDRIEC